jgi:hypothetical protein
MIPDNYSAADLDRMRTGKRAIGGDGYAYAGNNRVNNTDPLGLATLQGISYAGDPAGVLYDFQQTYNPTGYNSVVIHGNSAGQFSDRYQGGRYYRGNYLANLPRNAPGYNPKNPTILAARSSNSNANSTSGASGAQDFARELANPNSGPGIKGAPDTKPVYAPTSPVTPSGIPPPGRTTELLGRKILKLRGLKEGRQLERNLASPLFGANGTSCDRIAMHNVVH